MDQEHVSRDQLLERIRDLEMLNRQLLREKEEETRLEYAWTGNLGHWYWNIKTNEVTFNPLKVTALGYDKSEIPQHVSYQYFTDMLHPEDYQKAMDAMLGHMYGDAVVYEVEYRIRAKDGGYRWYYDRGRITQRDEQGKAAFMAGIVFDITEKKETQMDLENKNRILSEMSSLDSLTKISNHRTLIERLERFIAEARRTGIPLSMAMVDIDDFKRINDSKGHVTGDQVLCAVADIIKNSIRDTDLAARYGGDEFAVVFPGTEARTAAGVMERVRQAVNSRAVLEGLAVTLSTGVAQYSGEELAQFIDEADKKLYEAKHSGKNKVEA